MSFIQHFFIINVYIYLVVSLISFHLLTYLEEVLETTFCLVAQFYAGSVWQLESLQVLVQVEKVGEILLAEGLNHVPGVVFSDGDAI